ncbi:MAG: preprotein translocase subunit SecY [Acutalibacteraceae bacterium]|nr:preprotein translocase subunit SecY [Clostridia bacterium]MEE1126878.1 preprotein translocase subunit SecY [Acutalibacteraceae bacterium]
MFQILRNSWRVPEIRKKILYTLLIIVIFRVGSIIPVPFINVETLRASMQNLTAQSGFGEFMNYMNILTGGGLEYGAIFAMSVTPYINSSIIMQLLSVAIPYLERISKEGEEGRKKIAKITRFVTVALGLIQGTAFYIYLSKSNFLNVGANPNLATTIFSAVVIVLCFTAGSAIMMWLGERIDEKGIGNGISILLFAGIISRAKSAVQVLINFITTGEYFTFAATIIVFCIMIVFVIFMTGAERRIPVQYAKRVVGRKMYGGQSSHIPIKVNMSGVMPIIFASSFLSIPTMILSFMGTSQKTVESFWYQFLRLFSYQGAFYALLYLAMIIGFAYFYVQIQYNPVEITNNLKKNGGSVPGIRSGKPTIEFLKRILSRVTLIGALFLGVIAVLPIIIGLFNPSMSSISLGGTSILIVVGVALDTVQSLESQVMMRHYKGLFD